MSDTLNCSGLHISSLQYICAAALAPRKRGSAHLCDLLCSQGLLAAPSWLAAQAAACGRLQLPPYLGGNQCPQSSLRLPLEVLNNFVHPSLSAVVPYARQKSLCQTGRHWPSEESNIVNRLAPQWCPRLTLAVAQSLRIAVMSSTLPCHC